MSFLEVTVALFNGFLVSLLIFLVTLVLGAPLGLPIAFCSMSRFKPIQYIAKVFVWIVRGIPLMLQIFIIYYIPGLVFGKPIFTKIDLFLHLEYGIDMEAGVGSIIAVLIAFIINYACYFSEIYRGGIESISKGQYEAGYVLGLTKKQVFRHVVLKQVIQRIVPPMSNEIITLIKDTALANSIAVIEIIKRAKLITAEHQIIWPLFYTGAYFLIFSGLLTILFGYVEKKLDYFKS
jgi:polar amino acid transport system permease protein